MFSKSQVRRLVVQNTTERMAPKGKTWECQACGKKSDDLYGIEGKHSYGWDESCMLNAQLMDTNPEPKE